MKRLLQLVVVAGMMSFLACGPSAEEQALEQARIDSLKQDSITKVEAAKAAAEQVTKDSIAQVEQAKKVADSIEAAKKGKKK